MQQHVDAFVAVERADEADDGGARHAQLRPKLRVSLITRGESFDIHGGGTDLIFPHHENEIAQSEGARGVPFARYWLHNGMVNLGGEKMSKSTGQLVDLDSIISSRGGRGLRLLFLRAHYRSPIEYSVELLEDAEEALARLYPADC